MHFRIRRCANSFSDPKFSLSNNPCLSMVLTSQLFEITVSEDGVHDLPAKRVSKLFIRNQRRLRANRKMELSRIHVGANHLALTACSWDTNVPPATSTCDSCPHAAKDPAMASIHGQLLGAPRSHLTPPPVRDSGHFPLSVSIDACLVEPARRSLGRYSKDESDNNDSNDNANDGLSWLRSSVGGYKSNDIAATDKHTRKCNGENNDDYCSNIGDAMSLTNAAVRNFSFIERLAYYMDGELISMANPKSFEICIMIECGTHVRNMDPMRRERQEKIILPKYTSVTSDTKDMQFANDSARAAMLRMYSGGKKQLIGPTL